MENSKAKISNEDFVKASIIFAKNKADESLVRTTYFVSDNSRGLSLKKIKSYAIIESSQDGFFLIFKDSTNETHRLQVADDKEIELFLENYNFHEELFTKETRYLCEEFVNLDDKNESFACILHKFDKDAYIEVEYRKDLSKDFNERGHKAILKTYGVKEEDISTDDWIKILRRKR